MANEQRIPNCPECGRPMQADLFLFWVCPDGHAGADTEYTITHCEVPKQQHVLDWLREEMDR